MRLVGFARASGCGPRAETAFETRHRSLGPRRPLVLAGLLFAVSFAAAPAEQPAGARLYEVYCSNCHGTSGGGDGPMASMLVVRPADLRLIRTRNAGVFPSERIARTIDGREQVRGHGASEMPLWGLAFQETGLDGNQEREVQQRIAALIDHLRSLQAPATGEPPPRD